jgi:hypothetical protein
MEHTALSWMQHLIKTNSIVLEGEAREVALIIPADADRLIYDLKTFFIARAVAVVTLDARTAADEQIHRVFTRAFVVDMRTVVLLIVDSTERALSTLALVRMFIENNRVYELLIVAHKREGAIAAPMVVLPVALSSDLFYQLTLLVGGAGSRLSIDQLYGAAQRFGKMSWSQALSLAPYPALLGRHTEQFCSQWLDQIVMPRSVLFLLSQHFFAKERDTFYVLWTKLMPLYGTEFWLVFWSDLVWRAYCFLLAMEVASFSGDPTMLADDLKKGLPFSFIRYSWKQYQPAQLESYIQCLYQFDGRFKEGCAVIPFDLLFEQHFA